MSRHIETLIQVKDMYPNWLVGEKGHRVRQKQLESDGSSNAEGRMISKSAEEANLNQHIIWQDGKPNEIDHVTKNQMAVDVIGKIIWKNRLRQCLMNLGNIQG
jgi:hypothetical protein